MRNKVTSPVGKEEKKHRRGVASVDTARTRIIALRGWFDRKKEEKAGGSTPALVAALAGICNSWGIPYEEAYTETWELYGTECGVTKQKFQDTFAYIYRRHVDVRDKHGGRTTLCFRAVSDKKITRFPV